MHNFEVVTSAASYPVSVIEAKAHLNITSSTKDVYIESLLKTAITNIERFLNRALITQTYKVFYSQFGKKMYIPFGNLQSVTHVKYYDLDGVQQTLSDSFYWVVKETDPGYIMQKYDTTYPEVEYGRPNAIEIQFVCGYGAAVNVPDDIKHAIKLLITDYYENRGTVVLGNTTVGRIPHYLLDLIHSYKLYDLSC